MAKTTKPQGKKSVSIKAMFNKVGKDAPRTVTAGKSKACKVSKSSKHGKPKRVPVPEHALSTAFSGQISLLYLFIPTCD